MNKNKSLLIISAALMGMVAISACGRETIEDQTSTLDLREMAIVRVQNVSVSSTRTFIYLDNQAQNASSLTYGNAFPASTTSQPGFGVGGPTQHFIIKDTLKTTVQPALSFVESFQAGKHYTIFLYDTVTAIKKLSVQTNIVIPTDTTAMVRLGHFAFLKGVTAPSIDIFSVKRNENVFTNIPYGQVTGFIPFASAVSDTLVVRQAGSTTINLDTLRGFNPTRKRGYTLIFGGRYAINESGGTSPRTLSSTVNY